MKVIAWNMFRGFYVVSPDESRPNGHEFHYWAETIEECQQWMEAQQ